MSSSYRYQSDDVAAAKRAREAVGCMVTPRVDGMQLPPGHDERMAQHIDRASRGEPLFQRRSEACPA